MKVNRLPKHRVVDDAVLIQIVHGELKKRFFVQMEYLAEKVV